MGDAATSLPSLGIGGSLAAVIFYLLRFISQMQGAHAAALTELRQELRTAQETSSARADERARAAEKAAELARQRVAELEAQLGRTANPGDAMYARHLEQLKREGRGDEH